MTRRPAAKETRTERVERECVQEIGTLVAPSLQTSEVIAYLLVPGNGSRYRVFLKDGSTQEVSRARLQQLLREDVALAEIDPLAYERMYEATA